ncbi:hypothetical protein YC2023_105448 [Brassica napus]
MQTEVSRNYASASSSSPIQSAKSSDRSTSPQTKLHFISSINFVLIPLSFLLLTHTENTRQPIQRNQPVKPHTALFFNDVASGLGEAELSCTFVPRTQPKEARAFKDNFLSLIYPSVSEKTTACASPKTIMLTKIKVLETPTSTSFVSLYDNGDMATFVLLGDAGTEVMGKKVQDLMDYYLEVSSLLLTQLSNIYTHVQFREESFEKGIFRGREEHLEVYTVANEGQDSYVFRGRLKEIVERPILTRSESKRDCTRCNSLSTSSVDCGMKERAEQLRRQQGGRGGKFPPFLFKSNFFFFFFFGFFRYRVITNLVLINTLIFLIFL